MLLAVALAAAISASPTPYAGGAVSFSYPSTWQLAEWPERTRNYVPLVGVSTQALRDPCAVTADTIRCGFPVGRLRRGGAVAWWSRFGLRISLSGGATVRTNMTVGGRPASYRTWSGGHCTAVGGDKTIIVTVLPGDFRFEACLRRPGLAARERQIRALLASTTFAP